MQIFFPMRLRIRPPVYSMDPLAKTEAAGIQVSKISIVEEARGLTFSMGMKISKGSTIYTEKLKKIVKLIYLISRGF